MKRIKLMLLCSLLMATTAGAQSLQCSSSQVQALLMQKLYLDKHHLTAADLARIKQIPVKLSKFVTYGDIEKSGQINCRVHVALQPDQKAIRILSNPNLALDPELKFKLVHGLTESYKATLRKKTPVIELDSMFSVNKLSDGQLEIDSESWQVVGELLYTIDWFSVHADEIEQKIAAKTEQQSRQTYQTASRNLDDLWFGYSEYIQNQLQSEQSSWQQQKDQQCGNAENLEQSQLSIGEKIKIYQCQTKMIAQRIEQLKHPLFDPNDESDEYTEDE